MPFNEVSKHFREYDKANICAATVYNWVKKYGKSLRKFNMNQIPKISGKINLDEFVSKIKKRNSTGG